jgi:Zn-dependent protease with chaperone function
MASAVFHGRNAKGYQGQLSGAKTLITLIGALGMIISCGKQSLYQTSNDLKHNADEPVRSTSAWQWHELQGDEEARYLDYQGIVLDESELVFLKPTEPLVARTQAWVDKYDAALRAKYPEELASVPKPTALVKVDADPNAYVTPVPVCLDLRVALNSEADAEKEFPSVLITAAGNVVPLQADGVCVERHVTLEEARSFASWVSDEYSSCQLKVEETDEHQFQVVLGEGCKQKAPLQKYFAANKLIYMPTANRITVQSGITLIMEEEVFSAVLAHELGHYYRAHATTGDSGNKYDFFYKLDPKNHAHMPKADPELKALGEEVQKVFLPTRKYRRVPDQKFRSEFFQTLVVLPQIVVAVQECSDDNNACNTDCNEFLAWAKQPEVQNAFGDFPLAKLSEEGRKVYAELEDRAGACLEKVKVSDKEELIKKGEALPAGVVKKALMLDPSFSKTFADFSPSESVFNSLDAASTVIDAAVEASHKVLAKAKDLPLGYYTAEQEADELAVEWLAEIGVDPENAIKTELALTKLKDIMTQRAGGELFPNTVNYDRCLKLYNNGWKEENGDYFFVPIADFNDPHHSGCYRAFNVSREIEAHKFVPNKNAPAFVAPTADTWKDIQTEVISLHTSEVEESKVTKTKVGSKSKAEKFSLLQDEIKPKACAFHGNKAHVH